MWGQTESGERLMPLPTKPASIAFHKSRFRARSCNGASVAQTASLCHCMGSSHLRRLNWRSPLLSRRRSGSLSRTLTLLRYQAPLQTFTTTRNRSSGWSSKSAACSLQTCTILLQKPTILQGPLLESLHLYPRLPRSRHAETTAYSTHNLNTSVHKLHPCIEPTVGEMGPVRQLP